MSSTGQQDQMPPGNPELGLERIIFFSDAVMAIAITLLAVEIQVPEIPRQLAATELPRQLLSMVPKFTSFVLSFAIIGIYWLAHHRYYRYIVRYDTRLILLNLLFLFFIAILPFVTSVLGTYAYLPLANTAYASTVAALGLTAAALWWYASYGHRLVDERLDPHLIRATSIRALTAPLSFCSLSRSLCSARCWHRSSGISRQSRSSCSPGARSTAGHRRIERTRALPMRRESIHNRLDGEGPR